VAGVIDEMQGCSASICLDDVYSAEALLEATEVCINQAQEMAKQDLDDHFV